MINPVVYVFLNRSLNMSSGKAASQAVHAAILSTIKSTNLGCEDYWKGSIHKTVIVLELNDDAQMRNTRDYLKERDFDCHMVIDEGINEIDPMSIAALSTDMLDKDDPDVIRTFGMFKLYKDKKKGFFKWLR